MKYCTRCLNPANHPCGITFDDDGVCSGCLVHEEKVSIDYEGRWSILESIIEQYKNKDGSNYDCVIGVSGGKDSHYIVHVVKNLLGLNPLLVTYNHQFNTKAGLRNLKNLVKVFDCDHIRFTQRPGVLKRLMRVSLKFMGDMCWHCHTGIGTYPIQIAVKYNIPLIIWGDHGLQDMVGMFSHHDMVEWTKKIRSEHSMRGFTWRDFEGCEGLTRKDLLPYIYPSDEELERVGLRGIYLGNFINWDAKKQTELMIEKYGFETMDFERTHNCHENVECWHCNGAHDYLKYLKYGFGRATDHANYDIRHGRMTREQAVELITKCDSARPGDLDLFLRHMGMSEEELLATIERMRDTDIWERQSDGSWDVKDTPAAHLKGLGVEECRVPLTGNANYLRSRPKDEPGDDEYIFM